MFGPTVFHLSSLEQEQAKGCASTSQTLEYRISIERIYHKPKRSCIRATRDAEKIIGLEFFCDSDFWTLPQRKESKLHFEYGILNVDCVASHNCPVSDPTGPFGDPTGPVGDPTEPVGYPTGSVEVSWGQSRTVMVSHSLFQIIMEWVITVRAISGWMGWDGMGGYHDHYVC